MNSKSKVLTMATIALLTALIFVLQFITVPLGPITVSLSMVPVAIAAMALGPWGGLISGGIWGFASILKAMSGASGMTTVLFSMSIPRTIVVCFVPRMLDGLLLGLIFMILRSRVKIFLSGCIIGLLAALLNTIFFMSSIILLFGNTEYIQEMMGGRNVIIFILSIVAGMLYLK